jgi:HAMP domain-containing protein
MDARIETQSILYRTLWLFAAALLAVAAMFALVIWRVVKRSARRPLPTAGKMPLPGART